MEITNYKGIIVVDNFITEQENNLLVSLIEKPKCYADNTYWRFLGNDSRVAPLTLNYFGDKIYSSSLENIDGVDINNVYVDIKKRILNLIPGKHKVEHSVIEKFADYVPYICDKEMPVDDSLLGIPSTDSDNHDNFIKYKGSWGLTAGGSRKYAARIFINEDFKGGNLTFPIQKFDIQPVKDRLVLYPCSKEYVYGVRGIEGSSFYLTYWFNKA